MNHRKALKKKKGCGLGVIHELARIGKRCAYRVSKWMSNMIKKGFNLMRVGKTDLKNEQILSKGMSFFKNGEILICEGTKSLMRVQSISWVPPIVRVSR